MPGRLASKIALISGGATGMGGCIVEAVRGRGRATFAQGGLQLATDDNLA